MQILKFEFEPKYPLFDMKISIFRYLTYASSSNCIEYYRKWFPKIIILEYTINESDIYYGSFPGGFQFGVATASYQIEGGKELRGLNIWDKFTSTGSNIEDSSNGDTACDSYNKYHADVENVAKLGMDFYRFSISWPRLVPTGIVSEGINEVGIQYYHNLLDLLGSGSNQVSYLKRKFK